jgi:hypothetical protein
LLMLMACQKNQLDVVQELLDGNNENENEDDNVATGDTGSYHQQFLAIVRRRYLGTG